MSYRYLFGPVRSRRLGLSLGIDLTPHRECPFNCIYCECGRTALLTTERKEYVPTEEVIDELRAFLREEPELHSVTFAGSGEPTLHVGLGRIIATLKEEFPKYPVTVITNASLLPDPEVRRELLGADRVIPSLDAVRPEIYRRLNRPRAGLDIGAIIDGLRLFCDEYRGEIWLEVFILPGVNDDSDDIAALRAVLDTLRVDRVQLNTLDRPGTVEDISPAPRQHLEEIAAALGRPADIVASRRLTGASARVDESLLDLVHQALSLHPRHVDELCAHFGLSRLDAAHVLDILIAREKVLPRHDESGLVYTAVPVTAGQ